MTTAPLLLRVRPSLKPVGETRVTVIDLARCHPNTIRDVNMMYVETSMPGARASLVFMVTAPRLLDRRPAEIPVGVAGVTIIITMMVARRHLDIDRLGSHRYSNRLAHYLDVTRGRHVDHLRNFDIPGSDDDFAGHWHLLNLWNGRDWIGDCLVLDVSICFFWRQVVWDFDRLDFHDFVIYIVVDDLRTAAQLFQVAAVATMSRRPLVDGGIFAAGVGLRLLHDDPLRHEGRHWHGNTNLDWDGEGFVMIDHLWHILHHFWAAFVMMHATIFLLVLIPKVLPIIEPIDLTA